jgi:L-aspartate oxidase
VSESTGAVLDLLVLGSGVAGLSAAVRAATEHDLAAGVLTKGVLDQATTRWAQGGVAAALSQDPEEIDLHLADTLAAGAGLCDLDAVRVLVDEGPRRVEDLIAMGAEFDRDERGELDLAREGGHSVARVVHAGVATGAEVERALVGAVQRTAVAIYEHSYALDLIVEDGRCAGVLATTAGTVTEVRARHVLLATGGAGQLYAVTTNPHEATGDGLAMALRAGVAAADVEFFQFHPTALAHPEMPRPLLSEALRGHGARLRNRSRERFVDELLPRDVVSRAILTQMLADGAEHVWLDATGLDHFAERFPTIHADLARLGLDPARDLLPVAPAAHHQCGGIVTDLRGATSLPGLWAAGEVACTGVNGANRLASNSLLEGMVFGPRAVESIANGFDGPELSGAMRSVLGFVEGPPDADSLDIPGVALVVEPLAVSTSMGAEPFDPRAVSEIRHGVQSLMSIHAGVSRSAEGLGAAADALDDLAEALGSAGPVPHPPVAEVRNLLTVGAALVAAAAARTETRGCHARIDYPDTSDSCRHRFVLETQRMDAESDLGPASTPRESPVPTAARGSGHEVEQGAEQ